MLLPLGAALMAGGLSISAFAAEGSESSKAAVLPTIKVQTSAEEQDGYPATTTRVGKKSGSTRYSAGSEYHYH